MSPNQEKHQRAYQDKAITKYIFVVLYKV